MTGKEALKEFESIISMQDILRIKSNLKMWNIIKKSLNELEELKKRDTAIKPRLDEDSSDVYRCPKCLGVVHEDYISHDIYCHCCGQRLDWGGDK